MVPAAAAPICYRCYCYCCCSCRDAMDTPLRRRRHHRQQHRQPRYRCQRRRGHTMPLLAGVAPLTTTLTTMTTMRGDGLVTLAACHYDCGFAHVPPPPHHQQHPRRCPTCCRTPRALLSRRCLHPDRWATPFTPPLRTLAAAVVFSCWPGPVVRRSGRFLSNTQEHTCEIAGRENTCVSAAPGRLPRRLEAVERRGEWAI